MAHYQTEQRKMLLAFLKAHSDQAYTIDELWEAMKEEQSLEIVPGKSTIYRMMPGLVEERLVRRFVKGNSRSFVYQMICGEHGGDPSSVEFCNEIGLDYVSCSPFRVPIARLAAAQAAIKKSGK